jgi:hypothetical protein
VSHKTELKTTLNNKEYLLKALDKLKVKYSVAEGNQLTTKGHYGIHEKVEVLIHEVNGHKTSDAIGFQLTEDGNYKVTGDFYSTGTSAQSLTSDITVEAKSLESNDRLMQMGFNLESVNDNSKEVELVFTRWV